MPADDAVIQVREQAKQLVAELAAAGLWLDDLPGGYSIRNWDKYNQSREYWEDRHAKEAARIAEFRARKKAEREGLS